MSFADGLDDAPQAKGDASLYVRFFEAPKQNAARTLAEGRPCFDDVTWIEIVPPGDRGNAIQRPARDDDKARFRARLAVYKADPTSGGETGTSLKMVPFLSASQVEELAYVKCTTLEQLAGMSDANLKNIGPFLKDRQAARDYLEAAKGNAPLVQMRAELDRKDIEFAALKAQLAMLIEAQTKK